jgi:uncharacterized protein (TIGR01619 family)
MNGAWDFYQTQIGEHPASIFLDLELRERAPIREHSWSARLRIYMRAPRENGLSSQEEYEQLLAVEDALTAAFIERTDVTYAGRVTAAGTRDFFFFVSDSDSFGGVARGVLAKFPEYRFELGGRPDPEWATYFDLLSPDAYEMECIQNRHVCEALSKRGDDGRRARTIEHWAYFKDAAGRDAFAKWAEHAGFQLRGGHDDELSVQFFRDDVPVELDEVTLRLRDEARAHGGDYDGWESPVMSDAPTDA